MMIVMIGGKARVGKTTLANWFSKYVYDKGYSPVMLPFAQILKQAVERTGLTKEKNPEEYRIACQVLGSTKRKEDGDHWIKQFDLKLKEIKTQDVENLEANPKNWHEKCVIVDDCRYLNEVGYGRKIGALQIFVAHGDRKLYEHDNDWRKHESEEMANNIESGVVDFQGMFHYRLKNDQTEDDFKGKVTKLFDGWMSFISEDDKVLCTCASCLALRADVEISDEILDSIVDKIMKGQIEEEEHHDDDEDDDTREDA